jgi:hypothetical protein
MQPRPAAAAARGVFSLRICSGLLSGQCCLFVGICAELPGVWLRTQQDDRRRVQGHDHVNADVQSQRKVSVEGGRELQQLCWHYCFNLAAVGCPAANHYRDI